MCQECQRLKPVHRRVSNHSVGRSVTIVLCHGPARIGGHNHGHQLTGDAMGIARENRTDQRLARCIKEHRVARLADLDLGNHGKQTVETVDAITAPIICCCRSSRIGPQYRAFHRRL